MSKKGGNFIEEHVEKAVLVIVGAVCVWFLTTRFIISPNSVKYQGKKFNVGQIDEHIWQQAERLSRQVNLPPKSHEPYKQQSGAFMAKLESVIADSEPGVYFALPPIGSAEDVEPRKYVLPQIGEVEAIEVGHLRAVAHVPLEEVYMQKDYDDVDTEPNDIDFVTVAAKYDIAGLYDSFYESFAGTSVPVGWRDPCLGRPVFAAVEFYRQQILSDGSWSEWQIVPRTRIDHRKVMFRVTEDVGKLPPGGTKLYKLRFDNMEVQKDLLQPAAYKIASAEEQWFPPSLHERYVQRKREIKAQQRRKVKETERQQREAEQEQVRTKRVSKRATERSTGSQNRGDSGAGRSDRRGGGSGTRSTTRRTRLGRQKGREQGRPTGEKAADKEQATVADIYEEFKSISITADTDFSTMREPVTLWAHDDTVKPGQTYRYKLRLGVINPVVGTDWFAPQYEEFRDKVMLWSRFSDVTEPVSIPMALYFFPYDILEVSKAVKVTVCRYVLGYWYSEDFYVRPGEVIGSPVRYEPTVAESRLTVPGIVDYSTGATMVDVLRVNDWRTDRTPQPRNYINMLYSFDAVNVERMPVRMRYWSADIQLKFNEIRRLQKEPKQPLRGVGVQAEYGTPIEQTGDFRDLPLGY